MFFDAIPKTRSQKPSLEPVPR